MVVFWRRLEPIDCYDECRWILRVEPSNAILSDVGEFPQLLRARRGPEFFLSTRLRCCPHEKMISIQRWQDRLSAARESAHRTIGVRG